MRRHGDRLQRHAGHTLNSVDQAPRGELKTYPYAHFEFYRPEVRAQVVKDQIDFLRQHLLVNQP